MRTCCASLAVLLATMANAGEPMVEKVDLFQAQTDGYALYRIPGLVVTKRGTVLAYCEARRTGRGDWDTIDIFVRRSTDNGRTWGERQRIADVPGPKARNAVAIERKQGRPDDVTYNNPVAIADREGAVHFLFCLEYARCFYLRSEDDGVTWTSPVEITAAFEEYQPDYAWRVLATGPGHGIQLQNGRLVVPVWLSLGTGTNGHSPSVTAVIFSDDHGKSWQGGDIVVANTKETPSPNETAAVELADRRVMFNIRNHAPENRRLVTISENGATGWSRPRLDPALGEPICMASLARVSKKPSADRNRIVFANPDSLKKAVGKDKRGGKFDRRNLSVKLSYDEGATWPVNKSLEPGNSAYSDLAVLPDGDILCFYERGGETDDDPKTPASYAYLTLARFNLEWLTDGRDTLRGGK